MANEQINKDPAATEEYLKLGDAQDFMLGINVDSKDRAAKDQETVIFMRRARLEAEKSKIQAEIERQAYVRWMKDAFREMNMTFTEEKDNSFAIVPHKQKKTNSNAETIQMLKREIKMIFQKLMELTQDVVCINARMDKLQKEFGEQLEQITTFYKVIIIAIICMISKEFAKQIQRRRAFKGNDNEWGCINQLSSRNHASIRMADLRRIINRYHNKLGHIKTIGRGRTKRKIVDDLTAFQNSNVV